MMRCAARAASALRTQVRFDATAAQQGTGLFTVSGKVTDLQHQERKNTNGAYHIERYTVATPDDDTKIFSRITAHKARPLATPGEEGKFTVQATGKYNNLLKYQSGNVTRRHSRLLRGAVTEIAREPRTSHKGNAYYVDKYSVKMHKKDGSYWVKQCTQVVFDDSTPHVAQVGEDVQLLVEDGPGITELVQRTGTPDEELTGKVKRSARYTKTSKHGREYTIEIVELSVDPAVQPRTVSRFITDDSPEIPEEGRTVSVTVKNDHVNAYSNVVKLQYVD
eukprot:TRINITY_DN7495_c2_g1_i1.p2 TRINITY_DN7495_c2_g1~~TRINITY_DN7495_c2_g1_i1.p2  ORF type:complete len:278 (+),score=95.59 TRINITY_DN7495_c2_g1_i1:70-903(+)